MAVTFTANHFRHKQNGCRQGRNGDRFRPSGTGAEREAKLGGLERGQRPLGQQQLGGSPRDQVY